MMSLNNYPVDEKFKDERMNFPVVLFIPVCCTTTAVKVAESFESVDHILKCNHPNESSCTVHS